jgi:hypothetical protein
LEINMAQNPWDEYQPTAAPVGQGVLIPKEPEKPKEAPAGYRYNAEGNVEFIPGGPADPAVKQDVNPSEGDKKVLQLLTRIAGGATDIQNALANQSRSAAKRIYRSQHRVEQLAKV